MEPSTIIGSTAALCTTIAFIPQAIQVYSTRRTHDLSLAMLLILTFGIFLWTLYGLLLGNRILITANSISLVISGYVLYMKVRHG